MTRHVAALGSLIVSLLVSYGQSATKEFEVAAVHENKPSDRPEVAVITDPPAGDPVEVMIYPDGRVLRRAAFASSGIVTLRYLTLSELIMQAYKRELPRDEYLTGGPAWMTSDHFDLIGKAPEGTSIDDQRLMIQQVLRDRFQMKAHREEKPLRVYVLEVDKKGAKLNPTTSSGPPNCRRTASGFLTSDGKVISEGQGQRSIVCTNMTMVDFASRLPKLVSPPLDRSVVDTTNLKGAFDFEVRWAVELSDSLGTEGLDALEKQLGLKVQPSKQPVTVLVVDHAEKPSEN